MLVVRCFPPFAPWRLGVKFRPTWQRGTSWLNALSGREQKENGGSSKGEKYFGCGNHPLVGGLRRPERSEGRRSPPTKGHADALLNCEKNNWPNVWPAPFSNPFSNRLTLVITHIFCVLVGMYL